MIQGLQANPDSGGPETSLQLMGIIIKNKCFFLVRENIAQNQGGIIKIKISGTTKWLIKTGK